MALRQRRSSSESQLQSPVSPSSSTSPAINPAVLSRPASPSVPDAPSSAPADDSLSSPCNRSQQLTFASVTTPPSPPAESVIRAGSYEIHSQRKLGCSTLVQAFRIEPDGRRTKCAAKIVDSRKIPDMLQREGQALALLQKHSHLHLPKLLAAVELPDNSYAFVQPEVGEDLHSYIRKKGRFSDRTARAYLLQLIRAVAHLHKHRIVCRDLKVSKLFFKDESMKEIVLADLEHSQPVPFGAPLLYDQQGSPAYVTPEVLMCLPHDGAAADVWAVGAIFYVFLTGAYPFHDNIPSQLAQKIHMASKSVNFPPYVSERSKNLITRILSRDPSLRPTIDELLEELSHDQLDEEPLFSAGDSSAETVAAPHRLASTHDDACVPEFSESPAVPQLGLRRHGSKRRAFVDEGEPNSPTMLSSPHLSSSSLTLPGVSTPLLRAAGVNSVVRSHSLPPRKLPSLKLPLKSRLEQSSDAAAPSSQQSTRSSSPVLFEDVATSSYTAAAAAAAVAVLNSPAPTLESMTEAQSPIIKNTLVLPLNNAGRIPRRRARAYSSIQEEVC